MESLTFIFVKFPFSLGLCVFVEEVKIVISLREFVRELSHAANFPADLPPVGGNLAELLQFNEIAIIYG